LVRPLDDGDAAAWQALRLASLLECPTAFAASHAEEVDVPLDTIADRLRPTPGSVMLGAFDDRTLVGTCGLHRERLAKLAHKAVLWGVYVAPPARGQGVGRALIQAALNEARTRLQVRRVLLGVNVTNAPAIALYEACGFERYAREAAYLVVDGVAHDEWQMVKVLTA
jgi:ribosomal protein S18 acetylase RimI-like enzyme